jgi:hypothetical protein
VCSFSLAILAFFIDHTGFRNAQFLVFCSYIGCSRRRAGLLGEHRHENDADDCVSLITAILIVTVYFGFYSVTTTSGQGKGYFAVAAAAFTLGLTIFGECFNVPLEKCKKIKLRSSNGNR